MTTDTSMVHPPSAPDAPLPSTLTLVVTTALLDVNHTRTGEPTGSVSHHGILGRLFDAGGRDLGTFGLHLLPRKRRVAEALGRGTVLRAEVERG